MHRRHRQLQRAVQVLAQVAEVGRSGRRRLGAAALSRARRPTPARCGASGGRSSASTGSSICTQSAPACGQPRRAPLRRPAAARRAARAARRRPSWHLPSSRNVSGPSSTGRVWMPSAQRLVELVDRLGRGEPELHARLELGHDVVVVRVEPLGHVQRRRSRRCRGPWRSRSPDRPRSPATPNRFGHGPDHDRRVEHVVVEREVVGRDVLDAQRPLQLPVPPAQLGGARASSSACDSPAQNPSTARFSSRRAPMRGKPRLVAMAMAQMGPFDPAPSISASCARSSARRSR